MCFITRVFYVYCTCFTPINPSYFLRVLTNVFHTRVNTQVSTIAKFLCKHIDFTQCVVKNTRVNSNFVVDWDCYLYI